MTPAKVGFLLESLSLVGPGKAPAELTFTDGVNVVTGASDTGKSYALGCVDYAFGARKAPRAIPQAEGYQAVVLRIRARESRDLLEITRAVAGGHVQIRAFDSGGELRSTRIVSARHDANDADTLSGVLLGLSGLGGKQVRRNKQGHVRSLSFRDVAFLILVDEERIISERPPHISGSPVEKTVESAAFRLLATGSESSQVIETPPRRARAEARAQVELVRQLEAQVTAEIERLGLIELDIDAEIARIEAVRNEALAVYEGARVELVDIERRIAETARELRDTDARTLVVEGLQSRFELLGQHYESDLSRLEAIQEAGTLLEALPTSACPVCGAAPKDHRGSEAEAHFRLDDIRTGAEKEAAKVAALQSDLFQVLGDLSTEVAALRAKRNNLKGELAALQRQINGVLQPKVRASAEALHGQTERRDILLRARTLVEQRATLRRRVEDLERAGQRGSRVSVETVPTTAELENFAMAAQELLREWNYPDAGRVVFSESDQDLVIGGQPRGSHGKGVRALTCAAFITGLMRHCLDRGLPHPGVVLLDSPLVVYREPDVSPEDQLLRQAGVKDAFYRSLSTGAPGGQVIVFENEDPPADVPITRHHFFKSAAGRYGFIPL